MTISNTSRTAGPFIGNGVTKDFPFAFKVFTRDDILVAQTVTATNVESILTIDADYTVTLNADQDLNPGGVLHMTVPVPVGTTLAATSDIDITQTLDLTNQGGFYPKSISNALDRLTIIVQQLSSRVGLGQSIGASATLASVLAFTGNLAQAAGSTLVGFTQLGLGAVSQLVQDKLRESVSVFDYMSAAQKADVRAGTKSLDVSGAIQLAINAAGPRARIIYPKGVYRVAASVNLGTEQEHIARGAVIDVAANVSAFVRTTDGYPGRISFEGFRFQGAGGSGSAIAITNNTPFVTVKKCMITGFGEGVRLSGSYCSSITDTYFLANTFGLILLGECHSSTLRNVLFDANTYTGLGINGDSVRGNLSTNPMHNVTLVGVGLQNSEFGLWAENCLELHLVNIYHEGNTKADLRLGVGDAGAYARACYNFTVDGWQSSSSCINGKNIIVQHAVNGNLRGLAFNAGTANNRTLVEVDGYSDLISLDYHRVQTTAGLIGATVPFSVPAGRVLVSQNGRRTVPMTMKATRIGSIDQIVGDLWGTYTSGGRPLVQLETSGSGYDLSLKSFDLIRFRDSGDNDRLLLDHLNQRLTTTYTFQPAVDGAPSIGGSTNRFAQVFAVTGTINTSDQNDKESIDAIPQAWLDAWADVQWCRFKFKDAVVKKADGARWHVGVIAQRVKAAFEAHGVDPFAIGLLCYDQWSEKTDVDGNVTPAGNRYGIRYEEALALECAYLRSKLSK